MRNLNFKNWLEQNFPVISMPKFRGDDNRINNPILQGIGMMNRAVNQSLFSGHKNDPIDYWGEDWALEVKNIMHGGEEGKEWAFILPQKAIGESPESNSKKLNDLATQAFQYHLKSSEKHHLYAGLDWNTLSTKVIREQPLKTKSGEEPGYLIAVRVLNKVQTSKSKRGYF
jgi:hypothetical protein